MIAELGHFALILAFCLTLPHAVFGLAGAAYRKPHWMSVARGAVAGQFVFAALAFACLSYAFYVNDFSVLYVAQRSEEHTSELQSRENLVCRLLLDKKKKRR